MPSTSQLKETHTNSRTSKHSSHPDKKKSKATKSIKKSKNEVRGNSRSKGADEAEKKKKVPKKRVYNFQGPVKKLFRFSLIKELKNKEITFSDKGAGEKFNQMAESFLNDLSENIKISHPPSSFNGKRKVIKVDDAAMVLKVGKHFKNNSSQLLEGGNLAVKEFLEEELRKDEEGVSKHKDPKSKSKKTSSKKESGKGKGNNNNKKPENEVVMEDVQEDEDVSQGESENENKQGPSSQNNHGEEEVQQAQDPLEEEMSEVEQEDRGQSQIQARDEESVGDDW